MRKVHTVCYWIVGTSVMLDLHAENGDLIRLNKVDEAEEFAMGDVRNAAQAIAAAGKIALDYGKKYGASAYRYDPDTTRFYAEPGDPILNFEVAV